MALTLRMVPGGAPRASVVDPHEDATITRPVRASVPEKAIARRCPACDQAFSGEALFCPFDGDPLVDAPDWNPALDTLIGEVIDKRYEVASVIGEGGMGTVYEVRHVTLGRPFALKVLRRDIADAEHTARFIQEARAAAAIGHPNIVAVSDFGELSLPARGAPRLADAMKDASSLVRVPYFVMEHLVGTSLAAVLRSGEPLEAARAIDIFTQAAAGLASAHEAGVVHRDLKPDNVFLTRSGDRELVKLLDFGVAKMAGAGRLTRAGIVFGTPHYMSPEQAEGQTVDRRTDVYALGVILYEALSGHVPFEADTYMGVLKKHMFDAPEPLERVVADPGKLGGLATITMRCLAKKPEDRYATMTELGAALEAARETTEAASRRSATGDGRGARVSSGKWAAGAEDRISTPGLRPAFGPAAYAVGALALVGLGAVVALNVRGSSTVAATAATATVNASAGAAVPAVAATAVPGVPASAPAPASADAQASVGASAAPAVAKPVVTQPRTERRSGRRGADVVDPWKH